MTLLPPATKVLFAIEVLGPLENPYFVSTTISIENKTLTVGMNQHFDHWQSLVDFFPKNATTLWIINDEGVLTKIRNSKSENTSFEQAFPQLEYTKFYWSSTPSIWSLTRKSHWQSWEKKIEATSFTVLNVSLGSSVLKTVNQEWNELIYSNRYCYHFKEGELLQFSPMEESATTKVKLLNEELPAASLLGFLAVLAYCKQYPVHTFHLLFHLLARIFSSVPPTDNPFKEQQRAIVYAGLNQRFRKVFIRLNSALLICLLCIAFGLHYGQTKEEQQQFNLQQEYHSLQQQTIRLDALGQIEEKKWRALEQKATLQIIPFIDEILHSLPQGVVLEQLQWKEVNNSNTSLSKAKLQLNGKLIQKNSFTNWVNQLHQLSKVEDVYLAQLVVLKSPSYQFELQITFNAQSN